MSASQRAHFTMIEYIADDELDPFQMKTYVHYKRRAWELNTNSESSIYDVWIDDPLRDTAKACKMSTGKLSQARRELAELGYLETETLYKPGTQLVIGSRVRLRDRWADNAARFGCSPDEHREDLRAGECSPDEHQQAGTCSCGEHERSPHEHHFYIRRSSPDESDLIDSSSLIESTADDDSKKLIDQALDTIGLAGEARDSVHALPAGDALALIWTAQQRGKSNPAGLLAAMLRAGQQPAAELVDLARFAVENGIAGEFQARAEYRAANNPEPAEAASQHDPLPRAPAVVQSDTGIDWDHELEQINGQPLTLRSWWSAAIDSQQLARVVNAESYAGGVLTLRAFDPRLFPDRLRDHINRSFARYGRVIWADGEAAELADAAAR